ncbi:sulfate ABC transporter ATP-binding protein [archaeon SCG-AAA382B04]|nr:sulfate ABC transporter ATP-binding protein [archaeon SCG-AAA382B04]
MLKIEGLSNDWGRFQLKNIDLEINEGEFLVILGPSGSGKTLLLETIAGFTIPDEGKIIRNKKDITKFSPEKRDLGFVYQDFALFPHLTVRENIAFGLEDKGSERVKKLASFLSIEDLLDENTITLSGGEKQRVTLARAIATKPNFMLFDEPLSSLDERIQEKMRREIKEMHKNMGLTSIYVTHDQSEAMYLADQIAIMMEGKIVQTGKPEDVFYEPKNEEIAKFVGIENIYSGNIKEKEDSLAKIDIGKKQIEAICGLEKGSNVRLMIRPEEVFIKKQKNPSSARNQFKGVIKEVIDEGSMLRLKIDCGFKLTSYITRKSFKEMELKSGEKIVANFKASSVHSVKE